MQRHAQDSTWTVRLQASLMSCCLIQPLTPKDMLPVMFLNGSGRSSGTHDSSDTTRICSQRQRCNL